jgi:hypothetical protein
MSPISILKTMSINFLQKPMILDPTSDSCDNIEMKLIALALMLLCQACFCIKLYSCTLIKSHTGSYIGLQTSL